MTLVLTRTLQSLQGRQATRGQKMKSRRKRIYLSRNSQRYWTRWRKRFMGREVGFDGKVEIVSSMWASGTSMFISSQLANESIVARAFAVRGRFLLLHHWFLR